LFTSLLFTMWGVWKQKYIYFLVGLSNVIIFFYIIQIYIFTKNRIMVNDFLLLIQMSHSTKWLPWQLSSYKRSNKVLNNNIFNLSYGQVVSNESLLWFQLYWLVSMVSNFQWLVSMGAVVYGDENVHGWLVVHLHAKNNRNHKRSRKKTLKNISYIE
jgi:hypothetical protein